MYYSAYNFASCFIRSDGSGKFEVIKLPVEAQFAPVMGMVKGDFNMDGNDDVLVAGNLFVSEVETGRADAGTGLLLVGDGKGNFTTTSIEKSGFYAPGDVRDLGLLKGSNLILVANNNHGMQIFRHASETGNQFTLK